MFLEGNAAQQVGFNSHLQIAMTLSHTFSKCRCGCDSPLQIEMAIWHVSNLEKKVSQMAITLQRAVTSEQITQQFAEGKRALKAVKAL
jgi:hypothetical protein